MINLAKQHSYEFRTVNASGNINKKTILFKKASNQLIIFNSLKVAVLGITFKPGTDDLRKAASLNNVPLLDHSAEIYAYDLVGKDNF